MNGHVLKLFQFAQLLCQINSIAICSISLYIFLFKNSVDIFQLSSIVITWKRSWIFFGFSSCFCRFCCCSCFCRCSGLCSSMCFCRCMCDCIYPIRLCRTLFSIYCFFCLILLYSQFCRFLIGSCCFLCQYWRCTKNNCSNHY